MNITQLMQWPLIDAIAMQLTCTASVGWNLDDFVDMKWTGPGLQRSLWIEQADLVKHKNCFERTLQFRPWLDTHAGEYTCHLIMKNNNNSVYQSIKVKGN